jgi:GDPmannose 4,6-dehydratase
MKSAAILGATGQDGYFLAKHLLFHGYRVNCLVADSRRGHESASELDNLGLDITYVNMTNPNDIFKALVQLETDEFYNLLALSSVYESIQNPKETFYLNTELPIFILDALSKSLLARKIKIYQASSSEMFGISNENPKSELSQFMPVSPYGVSKLETHKVCGAFRDTYDMHVSSGILFNHESSRRPNKFVTRKISQGIARIATGEQIKIELGNLEIRRDWGYAPEYVEAMWLMLQQDTPGDYVIATGESHSIRDFLTIAIDVAGLSGEVEEYVSISSDLVRTKDIVDSFGNPQKALINLGWSARTEINELVRIMVEHDLAMGGKSQS